MPARPTSPAPPTPRRSPTRSGATSSSSAPTRKGVHFERWRHINGCARFFNAVRETVSDKFLATYKAGEPRPDLASLTGDAK